MIDLALNRKLTKQFIDVLPVTLTLTPNARTRSATGGFTFAAGTPRAPQVFTLIEQGTVSGMPRPEITLDGIVRVVEFELLGEYDSELARYDTFTHQGKEFEVVDLFYDNGYERRALVSARG